MQTSISQRAVPASGAARASRSRRAPQQQLVAMTGFRKAGAVDGLGSSGAPATLQAAVERRVQRAAVSSGVRVMRVTRMMFERFTEKAIKVVMLAQEEARRLGHNFVGTEQILLGLIGESTGEQGRRDWLAGRAARLAAFCRRRRRHGTCRRLPSCLCSPFPPFTLQASPPRCSSPWA